jgi:polygalacturonase
VHLLTCENVAIRNVTILNPWFAQNGDGLDIESCRNVEISDCFLDVGDDAICLKSGKDAEGRKRAQACEDIAVRGCTVLHGHGGLVVGSEMSGGVRNVHVSNCEFRGTDVGLRFKTARGRGGIVENIDIHGIIMSGITGAAISFDMYYGGTSWSEDGKATMQAETVTEATPQFRSVSIRNVSCDGARRAIELRGLPEMPIESITLENVRIRAKRGVLLQEVKDVVLSDVEIAVDVMPAMDCSDVSNLSLQHFRGVLSPSPSTPEYADLTPVLRTVKTLSEATQNGHQRVG